MKNIAYTMLFGNQRVKDQDILQELKGRCLGNFLRTSLDFC